MTFESIQRRKRGRPKGSRDLHGHAKRVDPQWMRAYSMALARNIRTARLERHIAIRELAAAAGVDEYGLFRLETGYRRSEKLTPINPTYHTIVRIALALGLSPSELLP